MYRQGDVLLVPVAKLPLHAKKVARQAGRVVLALGEATGHAHAIEDPAVDLVDAGFEQYLRVGGEGATLKHEEHAPIRLPAGAYRVVLQREYQDEGSRQVAD